MLKEKGAPRGEVFPYKLTALRFLKLFWLLMIWQNLIFQSGMGLVGKSSTNVVPLLLSEWNICRQTLNCKNWSGFLFAPDLIHSKENVLLESHWNSEDFPFLDALIGLSVAEIDLIQTSYSDDVDNGRTNCQVDFQSKKREKFIYFA